MAVTYLLILMKKQTTISLVAMTGLLLVSCQNQPATPKTSSLASPVNKPLPSWTKSKKAAKSTRQVKILSKLIEVTREKDATNVPLKRYTKMMSSGEAQTYLRTLSQKKGADIMTSPSVVARDGQTATIEFGKDFAFPAPGNSEEFKTELIGIKEYFRARSLGYGRKFKLDSVIKVTESDGSPPPAGEQPAIRSRRIEDSVAITSGRTVVYGGYVTDDEQEIKGKIPVLGDIPLVGRLFSSQSTHEFTKELIVMITLTEVDRSGRELIPSGGSR